MKKYKKNFRRKSRSKLLVLILFTIAITTMSIGYSYFTETLTIKGDANAKYTMYNIEYMLNGGKNPENAITSYKIVDDIPLPIPTKSGYKFLGWYDGTGTKIATTKGLNGDITVSARWKESNNVDIQYYYDGEYVFTGSNYIDTNVFLYSEENVNKDFIISFDIIEVDEKNINHSALMNSMNESGSPWYGNVVKVSVSGQNKRLKFESNSNTSSTGDVYIQDTVKNVRIIRMDNILYYSFDNKKFIKINDYTGFKGTFNIPVTFGASMDGTPKPFRYFTGTLANMTVGFIDKEATLQDFEEIEQNEQVVMYANEGPVAMNGKTDYIDTGIYLFNYENIHKDFEISFKIDSVEEGNVNQATLVNLKNERITSYPGCVYRLYQSTDKTIRFEAKGGTGSGSKDKIADIKEVKISRIDDKIYLAINNGANKLVYDYTGFSNFFEVPLTIGASLDSKGEPFRFFKGTLSDIVVKVEE